MNALSRVPRLLEQRLESLEARIRGGDEGAWGEYVATAQALVAVLSDAAPGAGGRLLTTAELAKLLNVSPKVVLRRRKSGELAGAIQLGKRGRGALRWDPSRAVRP